MMADTTTLNRSEWKNALDQLTVDHDGELVTIEVLDPLVGHQHEAERLPFAYINYDPKDDVVIVAVGGRSARYPVELRHMVWHPAEVDIALDDGSHPVAVRVVEPDTTTTLVAFYPGRA
jgi:hypothetical protein